MKILIADDDSNVRRLVAVVVGADGNQILQARDGIEALEVARREHPDLVLLDTRMPGIDGAEVCRQIKEDAQLRGIVVVMLAGATDTMARQSASAAGAEMVLDKPFAPLQLVEIVERYSSVGS